MYRSLGTMIGPVNALWATLNSTKLGNNASRSLVLLLPSLTLDTIASRSFISGGYGGNVPVKELFCNSNVSKYCNLDNS